MSKELIALLTTFALVALFIEAVFAPIATIIREWRRK